MAPGHPLAKAQKLSLAECLAYPVAWPSRGLSLRAILDRALGSHRAVPQVRFECNSLRLMAALARNSNCIAFQTEIGIEDELAGGDAGLRSVGHAQDAARPVDDRAPVGLDGAGSQWTSS